jgi:hypothetical protein
MPTVKSRWALLGLVRLDLGQVELSPVILVLSLGLGSLLL